MKAYPPVYHALRGVRESLGNLLPSRRVSGIPGGIHWNDLMFEGATPDKVVDYRATGMQAVEFMDEALKDTGGSLQTVKAALDFGCGYGRVLRFLVQYMNAGRITACDIDTRAVAFCVKEFRARPLRADPDIDRVQFERYDLIWLGSVLTHIDAATGARLLSVLGSHLGRPGLLAFSTHGTHALEHLERFGRHIVDSEKEIRGALATSGVAYVPYSHYGREEYGLTWHDPQAVPKLMANAGLRLDLAVCRLNQWGAGKQDMWAFQTRNAVQEPSPGY